MHDVPQLNQAFTDTVLDLLLLRRMMKNVAPTPIAKKTGSFQLFPILTIMAASYECHDELPRCSNKGVETWPLRLFMPKLSGGPASTLREVRFFS